MRPKQETLIISLLVLALALPVAVFGQGGYTAAVRGLVTDSSGGAVPGAKVTVSDVARGTEFTTETDGQGRYAITNLPPSTYMMTVAAPGFKTYQRNPFELVVQQQATISVQLEVGEVTTVVEVSAAEPLLNTTIANLGQVIENRYIDSLPLISRSPMALTYLTAGVVRAGGRMGGQNNTNFVANGTRNSTADVILDGVSVTNVEQNSGITQLKYTPSVDAVQEFKVQTNFFSAEYGETGGAIINMVTKSGANDFHGTGYWFFRADELNANSFWSNKAGREKPDFRRHQYGGVVGGPIKKNKAFFFGTFQRTDSTTPRTYTATFPTLQQRQGDFSDYMTSSGATIQIFNPLDTYENAAGDLKRRPFPGNIVPQSMWSSVATNALAWFPKPNQDGKAFTHQNNWFEQGVDSSIANQLDAKVDWNISNKNRMTTRYSASWSTGNPAIVFPSDIAEAWTYNRGPSRNKVHTGMVEFTRSHSPTTIFTVKYGILRVDYNRDSAAAGFKPSSLGLPTIVDENAAFLTFPEFQPEGYTDIGTQGWLIIGRGEDVNQVSGSVTKIMSGHNLKVGAEYRFMRLDYLQPGYPSGSYRFNRQVTREDRFAGSSTQGNGLASMLLGWGNSSFFHHDPWSYSRAAYFGTYVQDDWKITRNLTLNLGLRYSFDVPRWEKENRYSYWDLDKPAPINDQVPEYDLRGVYQFVNVDGNPRSPYNGDYNNVAPRFGFAYALGRKISIRGGFGLFYALSRATVKGHLGSAFQSGTSVQWSRDSNATQFATLDDPYPNGLNLPPGSSLGDSTFIGLGASPAVRENSNPYYQSWNLSIQRQLPANSVLEVNYTGSKGTHLLFAFDTSLHRLDPIYWSLGRTALNEKVPNPFYGVITDPRSSLSDPTVTYNHLLRPMPHFNSANRGDGSEPGRGNSIYHAVQIKYEKRFSHGLSMLSHYTFGKMIDDISHGAGNLNWLGGRTNIQDWFNLRNERSLSANDVRHRFVLTATYEIPVGAGKAVGTDWGRLTNALLGGWEISGVWTYQSGVPMQVSQNGGSLLEGSQRPNLIGDPNPGGSLKDRYNNGWFNPAAFERPPQDVLGTAPRTINYRTPHLHNLDFALFKSFVVREGMRAEFRLEAENGTNVVTFGPPNTSFGGNAFGNITNYASGRGPRNIQLGVKFYF